MSDEWMPTLKLNLPREEFDRLPRHPAYKYELIDGVTYISPWPQYSHAQLDFTRFRVEKDDHANAELRPARVEDAAALVPVFLGAFAWLQPYGSLSDEQGEIAAERSLTRTFTDGDGPWIEAASFVALHEGKIAGAILITLLPGGDPADWDSYRWHEPAPDDLWAKQGGQPHLTWIFVKKFSQGSGVGTQLLAEAVRVLKEQRYQSLWTTFMVGNDSSVLWHWRNGFELTPNPLSKRRRRRELLWNV
jgi:GNAT superfamily N-acetyltransferase